MNQEELKSQIKAWLKKNNKDYSWLAEQCNVSRNTINNYLARKPIPESKIDILTSIINSESSIEIPAEPQVTRRKRRTRAQMREDLENEMRDAQEYGGYVDQEEEDKKAKLQGINAQLEYLDEVIKEREAVRSMEGFDMTDPENAECIHEGSVYRIIVPNNILKIYKEEAKWLNKSNKFPNRKVTVAMLLAKSIVQVAETMSQYEEKTFQEMERSIRLMEEKAQLKKDYALLKAKQENN
jgi:hypothetical protein